MTATTTKPMTIEDLEQLPDDDHRYTLIGGVLHRMPPPKLRHGRVAMTVGRYVGNFVEEHDLGIVYAESGFALARDPDVLVGPDVAFVSTDRVPADEDGYPDLAPNLVVEVLSPTNTPALVAEKLAEYDRAGVLLTWIFDPQRRTVRVRTADGGDVVLAETDELAGGTVLPGFRLPVARFFA